MTLLREEQSYSYYENRTLAAMPTFTAERVLNGEYFTGLENYLRDHAAGRETVLKLKTLLDLSVLRRPVVNNVVITRETLLPFMDYEITDPAAIQTAADAVAERLAAHAAQVEGYGGVFYYAAVPCQYVCQAEKYPWYLNNRAEYTAASSAALFARLESLGVSYIDMLDWYEAAGRPEGFTSTVDNHYGIQGGYWTYLALLARINADTGWGLDVLTENELVETRLPNPYLGSRGRALLDLRQSGEHLSILTLRDPISFTRQDYGIPTAASVYALPQTRQEAVLYSLYMGGDIANTVISTGRSDLPSILIYGDSFTNAVECVTWYSFDNMYSLDFRYYTQMTLEDFIREYQPDVVVCIRDYEAMLSISGNGK